MTADEIAAIARQLIADLGIGGDNVADRLRALHCKGRRGDGCQCPLAVYLLDRIPELSYVEVDVDMVTLWVTAGGPVDVELTDGAAVFVEQFDRGVHLDLVLADTEVTA